jgi:menaquinone-dependent protoporphyrinogen oxidase
VDPAGFDAVVVGSAVHGMAWLPEATAALGRAAGAGVPVWVFSVGSVEPRGWFTRRVVDRERARIEQSFPAALTPRDHRVFAGVVVTSGVPLWGRLFWRLIGGRPGDHRNWPAVEAWAGGIAGELATRRVPVPPD